MTEEISEAVLQNSPPLSTVNGRTCERIMRHGLRGDVFQRIKEM